MGYSGLYSVPGFLWWNWSSVLAGLWLQRVSSRLPVRRVSPAGHQTRRSPTKTQIQIHCPRGAERSHFYVRKKCASVGKVPSRQSLTRCFLPRVLRNQAINPEEASMMFVTKYPCDECVPLIRGAGITHIYTTDQDRGKDKGDISYLKFSSLKNISKFTVSAENPPL